ncbi:MAG: Fe-S cluster assembly ATPase SufC [Candidatus Aenigmatarchaeota archaeon]
MNSLQIIDLHVQVDEKEILKGINLKISEGEIHAIMGPNGSGKTSLCFAIAGHPRYRITKGKIMLNGNDITFLSPDERAKNGIFLAFQNPVSFPGLNFESFLRQAYNSMKKDKVSVFQFKKILKEKIKFGRSLLSRDLNDGFSGGEKKKAELLQLLMLQPKFAFLDEIDSGLDVDSLKQVCNEIKKLSEKGVAIVLITHYKRILSYIKPNHVHILVDGKIIKSGDYSLAEEVEESGYNIFLSQNKNQL